MTGAGTAQNKAGELFVDIGVSGVGKTLKALNSVSASFLLTKNAAVQLAKPLLDVGKKTLGMAVDVGKLGSTLGIAYKDAYKLQYYFKHMNLNEGLVNDIEKLSEQFAAIKKLGAAPTGEQAIGFAMLRQYNPNMNWEKYIGGGFDKINELIKDSQTAINSGMNRTDAAIALQKIGLSTEWLYAFDRGIFDLSDALSISNEQIEAAITASEDLNRANLAIHNALEQATIKLAPFVSEYAPKIADGIIKYTPKLIEGIDRLILSIEGLFQAIRERLPKNRRNHLKNTAILTGAGYLLGGVSGALGGAVAGAAASSVANEIEKSGGHLMPIGGGGQVDFSVNPFGSVPKPKPSVQMRVEINNKYNINGSNAKDIANEIGRTDKEIIRDMFNKYQVSNMIGK